MTIVFILLLASAILGAVTGLLFRGWALGLLSVLVAILSAVILRSFGFGFAGGVTVSVYCLIVSQFSYLVVTLLVFKDEDLSENDINGDPGGHREQDIRHENE